MNQIAKATPAADIMESVLMAGDLGKMSAADRVTYYNTLCHSLGLNPLTRPFDYITLNGKLTLYAKRDCADQLRRARKVSVEIISQGMADGLYSVHVRASDVDGRHDEDLGVVSLPDTTKGEIRANLILKAITKAKRRVTLSICGLGFLDETEVEDIPGARRGAPHAAIAKPQQTIAEDLNDEIPNFGAPSQTPEAPEQQPAAKTVAPVSQPAGAAVDLLTMAREAAMRGRKVFNAFYKLRNAAEKGAINQIGDELSALMQEADK